ncbi:hypothetical protein FF38_05613 [Lucilia cuprina]|uniref:Uncharacterized protein n=1 Tax=Lucilia cuprina TaxID=7375 RepID=A0A0L0BV35_LUCCU|nr:hypothetical protein FF38_05613 [Lucilia cuprina]
MSAVLDLSERWALILDYYWIKLNKYNPRFLSVRIHKHFRGQEIDEVAEWLRRWTANPMCSARVGSNPILVCRISAKIILK